MNTKSLQLLAFAVGCLSAAATTLNVTNYTSIQAAINAAVPGDTVYIPNGTYSISSPITPISGIVLTGQSQSGVIIQATGKTACLISLQSLTNVEISYLTLDG